MSVLNNSNAIESGGYNIDRSLRFRSSASAYLNRTPASASNRKTWTWSGWVKLGIIGNTGGIFESNSGSGNTSLNIQSGSIYFQQRISGSQNILWATTAVYRDPSAWYHVVFVCDTTQATSANAAKLYINGTLQTLSFTAPTGNYTQNQDFWINYTQQHNVGLYAQSSLYLDGYLAEVNFIDGQALTPSSFGQTDAVTGVWTPKKYTGTYGTNGFYLPFSDNTSATTLAYDKSGNGNNWTANNISTTSGASYDSMTDVPTQSIGQGNGSSNYPTLNPISKWGTSPANYGTASNGNLTHTESGSGTGQFFTTFPIPSGVGKWYWEITCDVLMPSYNYFPVCSLYPVGYEFASTLGMGGYASPGVGIYSSGSYYANNGAIASTTTAVSAGQTRCFAYDATTGKLWHRVNNGSWIGGGDPAAGTTPFVTLDYAQSYYPCVSNYQSTSTSNFGQRPFSYTPPTGFKALNTFNLPDPVIKKPNEYMDATTYTGTGGSQTVANAAGFAPDLVWLKMRNVAGENYVWDSVRGGGSALDLVTNRTNAEGFNSAYHNLAFASNGFTVTQIAPGNEVNYSGNTYVGWQWKKGATPGFDIVTWTGNGSATQTINHSLGVAPKMFIGKNRGVVQSWNIWHKSLSGDQYYLGFDTSAQNNAGSNFAAGGWGASSITVGNVYTNIGNTFVGYLFAEIAGFSKFGSYTGNGSADGPFVFTNFKPAYVMVKASSSAGESWSVYDNKRNGYNIQNKLLYPNLSNAENAGVDHIDLLSNGFKLRSNNNNTNGVTYIYAAFAENPFKYSNAR